MALSGDGKSLFFNDSEPKDENIINSVKIISLENASQFKKSDFQGKLENLEELFAGGSSTPQDEEIHLQPVKLDLRKALVDKWEQTKDLYFPTSFPKQPTSIRYTLSDYAYSLTLYIDEFVTKEVEISTIVDSTFSLDICIEDDLELVETKNGIDYYFKSFSSSDNELNFVMDGKCFAITGDDVFSQEDYLNLAYSLKKQGDIPVALNMEGIKFPTISPIPISELDEFYISYSENYGFSYLIYFGDSYGTTGDQLFSVGFYTSTSEVAGYGVNGEAIEVKDYEEAYFNPEALELELFDGKHYYSYEANMNTEVRNKLSIDNIKDMLIQMAESAE